MYIDPSTVLSPKQRVKNVDVVLNQGPGEDRSWSVARVTYDNRERIGIRWNGDSESHIGLPQSRGNPTWFIVPDELESVVLEAARKISKEKADSLVAGYQLMAADRERESEAEEWTEGLIADAY